MASTEDGRPVCGSCGDVYRPLTRGRTRAEFEAMARVAGWRIARGRTYGGVAFDDALCGRCGRPDPDLV